MTSGERARSATPTLRAPARDRHVQRGAIVDHDDRSRRRPRSAGRDCPRDVDEADHRPARASPRDRAPRGRPEPRAVLIEQGAVEGVAGVQCRSRPRSPGRAGRPTAPSSARLAASSSASATSSWTRMPRLAVRLGLREGPRDVPHDSLSPRREHPGAPLVGERAVPERLGSHEPPMRPGGGAPVRVDDGLAVARGRGPAWSRPRARCAIRGEWNAGCSHEPAMRRRRGIAVPRVEALTERVRASDRGAFATAARSWRCASSLPATPRPRASGATPTLATPATSTCAPASQKRRGKRNACATISPRSRRPRAPRAGRAGSP